MTGGGATPDERRLVVNADDFGFSAGVNRGILEAHAAGVVSSVSVLVNTPGWPDARDRLRAIGGTLGVGLHLNLTTGAPLTTAPSLTTPPPTARFHSLAALVARALTGRLDPAHVSAECAAQLARPREAGVRVALLDRLEPGTTELMVHPGHPDGDLAGWDDYTTPRAAELAALTSSVVRARFASGAFRLVHFGAL